MNDKIESVISVLEKRLGIVRMAVAACREQGRMTDAEYYLGKGHGYEQSIDMLKDTTDGIAIELEEKP